MARGIYENTITKADANSILKALSSVQVTVRRLSDNGIATIYQARTGNSQGPSPSSGGSGTNPFTTGSSGAVIFWAEEGEYTVEFHDLTAPPRMTDVIQGWNAVPVEEDIYGLAANLPAAGIPGRHYLATDIGVEFGDTGSVMIPLTNKDELGRKNWYPGDLKHTAKAVTAGSEDAGWLLCDGRLVSRTSYAALFAAIGINYGAGDGTTTFALPDYRGRTLFGRGTHADVNTLAANEGLAVGSRTTVHTHTVADHAHSMQGHFHTLPNHFHTVLVSGNTGAGFFVGGSGAAPQAAAGFDSPHAHSATLGGGTATDGGGGGTSGPSIANTGGATPGMDSKEIPHSICNILVKI